MQSMSPVGNGGTTVNTGNVNISVNGAKSPAATGKEVKKVMKNLGQDIDRYQAGVGASEQ